MVAGLGLQFLKHLARTKLLMHLVDVKPYESMDSPVESARKIIAEVEKWSDDLANKPRWLILNKMDRLQADEDQQDFLPKDCLMNWPGKGRCIRYLL